MKTILNLKLVILLKYQNIFKQFTLQIGLKKLLFTKRYYQELWCHHQWKKLSWLNYWFWYKIQRNKKINSTISWRLYYMTFAGLGIHQKSLKTNVSCFEETKRIRSWSKSNSIQQTKFVGQLKNAANTIVAGKSVSFNKFRKKLKKQD